jgi:putative transposase
MHVIQRSIDQTATVFGEGDDRVLSSTLAALAQRESVRVHADVLMTNPIHLLMPRATDAGPARLMKGLGQRDVQHIKRTDRRTGTFFERRFRASVIETDGDLLAGQRDIEPNPVRVRLVRTPEDDPWSSDRCNASVAADHAFAPHTL